MLCIYYPPCSSIADFDYVEMCFSIVACIVDKMMCVDNFNTNFLNENDHSIYWCMYMVWRNYSRPSASTVCRVLEEGSQIG